MGYGKVTYIEKLASAGDQALVTLKSVVRPGRVWIFKEISVTFDSSRFPLVFIEFDRGKTVRRINGVGIPCVHLGWKGFFNWRGEALLFPGENFAVRVTTNEDNERVALAATYEEVKA